MIEIKLGDRYANSILILARERGQMDHVRDDFQRIHDVCQRNRDFVNMLESPLVMGDKKQRVIHLIFGKQLCDITQGLLEIIIRKKRERYLDDIAERYLYQYDRLHNVTRGVVRSAAPLTRAQIAKIKQMVETDFKTTLEIQEVIDSELIGGFILDVGDKQFDASLATRLRLLKQEFDSNPYVKQL
jgi:F-type H+-transporting ATPase subunit delta